MKQVQYHLEHIVDYAIDWFTHLKEKYGVRVHLVHREQGIDTCL